MTIIVSNISYLFGKGRQRVKISEDGNMGSTAPEYNRTYRHNQRQQLFFTWRMHLTNSSSDRPLTTLLTLAKLLKSGSTSSKSSTLLQQQAMLLSPLTQSDSHTFAHLRSLNPFADIRQKFTLEGSSSRTSSLSAKKNNPQTTRNSDEILTPPCQMFLGHWRDTNVRVAKARARRSQLVKQIGTQPARDCQT